MRCLLALALALPLVVGTRASAQHAPANATPASIIAAAPDAEWIAIDPQYLLIMDLAPTADGGERRVAIQLMEPPLARGWIDNIQRLARTGYWDGSTINRVQDNYVVQWGQPDDGTPGTFKPVPSGLLKVPASEYMLGDLLSIPDPRGRPRFNYDLGMRMMMNASLAAQDGKGLPDRTGDGKQSGEADTLDPPAILEPNIGDAYAPLATFAHGWPLGGGHGPEGENLFWPVHCYGMVGVGRGLSPDTGDGSQLYAVIGHAPRQLDRNIALVGRVVEGMEHLSALPRGTAPGGMYTSPGEFVPIRSVRLASEMEDAPAFEFLSTESMSFAALIEVRANRKDDFYEVPAGGVDICNVPVPVRRITR